MGEDEHKIALFTDDVMMYLRDPAISARYSWYFIRIQTKCARKKKERKKKTVICYNFIPSEEKRAKYSINYNVDVVKYLGIYFLKDTSTLLDVNYRHLNSNLRTDIQRWIVIPFLNLGERVDIKINMLRRLLYLFHILPVKISEQKFKD